jgi:hypothetical protein
MKFSDVRDAAETVGRDRNLEFSTGLRVIVSPRKRGIVQAQNLFYVMCI